MTDTIKVPDIGDFKDVPVIEVHMKPGQVIAAEDTLITLESDKAAMDVPAPAAGTIGEVRVNVGDKVSAGTVIATFAGAAAARLSAGGGFAGSFGSASDGKRRSPCRGAGDRRGPWRLFGRVPGRRSRQEGRAGRQRPDARRGLPECRLHSIKSASACRQGDRRNQGYERSRCFLCGTFGGHRQAARLEGWHHQEVDGRPVGPCQTAQGHGGHRRWQVCLAEIGAGSNK